jgi:hypothetical protein
MKVHLDVGYFEPDYRCEIVKAKTPDSHLNIRGKRHHKMPATLPPGDTYVAYHTADPPTRYKYAGTVHPHFI